MSPVLKPKPEKEKLPAKYVLLILTVICSILMIISFTIDGFENVMQNVAGAIVVPFQKGVSAMGSELVEHTRRKESYEQLQAENEQLKLTIEELTDENTRLMQDKYELTSLRELYDLDVQYGEYEKKAARIISWDSGNWYNSFLIDKGSRDGMEKDMNVIAGNGLVGRITETGYNWSRVTTIIDSNSNVSAYVLHTQDNLIVSGDLKTIETGVIPFSNLLDKTDSVRVGDKVVTSYISEKYLPGLLIGYISTIELDSNHLTKVGSIKPVVDFTKLSEVLVIMQQKESLEETVEEE